MEIFALIIGLLGIIFVCISLYIIKVNNKKDFKSSRNLLLWNQLWKEICEKFHIGIYNGGLYGGNPAKYLLAMVERDYGILDEKQILFVRELVDLLNQILNEQINQEVKEYQKEGYFFQKSKLDLKPSTN